MNDKKLPPCKKRKRVDGFDMCYAIGCCEVGDMYCECPDCKHNVNGKCDQRSASKHNAKNNRK